VGLVIVLAVTAGVIGLVGRLPDARKVKRDLARARVQSIASLGDGAPAAVRGTTAPIAGEALVTSPLSNRTCMYWLVVFDEVGVGGDYHELGRIEGGVPFLLRSDTGTARVVPDKPRVALPSNVYMRPVAAPGKLGDLARGNTKPPNHRTTWLRATEYVLVADTLVTICGWSTREPDPEASKNVSGYREQLPTRPVISGSRNAKLMIG
jgi:hypothetical protein